MQKPSHKVELAKTEAEIRLTTGLDDATNQEVVLKSEIITEQEIRISTQTDMDGLELEEAYHPDRMLESTDTHTGGTSASGDQADTRHKTASGELSSLEKHHDPDGTMGCNTCQGDLVDAIADQCRINVGDVIASRYEIKQYLGEGGMSAVYAAVDRVIKRDVALKILHRDLLVRGKGSLLRFQREAQALGNLDHPNIVKIHHFDADENAQPYIVMDIVKGESLARRLVKEPESVMISDIIDIFVQVCDALEHAHQRGVVHRDLKPSNIMVVGNQVKVLDFGIAKLMSEDSDQELQLTRTGEVFGSPLYMSPEQCRGLKLDFRSDIYSIGCVMYEAFTGNPPFTGNSHIDTMLKHVNDMPSSVVSSMCDARYAEKVDAILLRCMAKSPNARFQSMAEVKAALLDLERDTKGPLEQIKRKLELIRLKIGAQGKFTKKMIAAYCAAGLVVTGFAATALINHQNSAVNFDFKNASVERWKELDERGQGDFDSGKFVQAETIFRGELDMADKLKNLQLRLASCNELLDLYRAQLLLKPELAGDKNFNERLSKVNGYLAQLNKEQDDEVSSLKKDLADQSSMSKSEKKDLCNRAIELATAMNSKGKHAEAIDLSKRSVVLAEGIKDELLTGKAHYYLGLAYNDNKDYPNAKAEFEKSLKLREKVLPKDHADIGYTLVCLARLSHGEAATSLLDRGRGVLSQAFSPVSHHVAWVDSVMSSLNYDAGNYRAARQNAELAVSKCKAVIEGEVTSEERFLATQTLVRALKGRALANQALLNLELQKGDKVSDKAERQASIAKDLKDALTYAESLNPKPNAFEVDSMISWLLGENGKRLYFQYSDEMARTGGSKNDDSGKPLLLNEAKMRLSRAIAINDRLPEAERLKKAPDLYFWMGKISRELLDLPFAEKMFRQSKELCDKAFGPNSPDSKEAQAALDKVIQDLGQNSKK